MMAALIALGLSPRLDADGTTIRFGAESINCATGQSKLNQNREVNTIKRAYSQQVVSVTAKKYGWQVQPQKQGQAATVYSKR